MKDFDAEAVHADVMRCFPRIMECLRQDETLLAQHQCGSVGCDHASDCALHNEPYMPAGPCNCGSDVRAA